MSKACGKGMGEGFCREYSESGRGERWEAI